MLETLGSRNGRGSTTEVRLAIAFAFGSVVDFELSRTTIWREGCGFITENERKIQGRWEHRNGGNDSHKLQKTHWGHMGSREARHAVRRRGLRNDFGVVVVPGMRFV